MTSAGSVDNIALVGPTNTTEQTITLTLPAGATIVRVMLAAFITIMNNSANQQIISIKVSGRLGAGAFSDFFNQANFIGTPAVIASTTGMVATQDVSALVTAAGTYGFRLSVGQSSANSVIYTSQFILVITYHM